MIDKLSEHLQENVDCFINGNNLEKKIIRKTGFLFRNDNLSYIMLRLIDITGSGIALIIFFPLILVISVLIYVTSGSPILFKQIRIGKNGTNLKIYKFRTMINDAEKVLKNDRKLYQKYVENDYKLKLEEDPRITKFGHFLRKSSLDEIPQILNVLSGKMSIVGPRPIVPKEIERYGQHVNEFLSVKPGITGLWQVTGRNEIDYPDRKYLDLIYVSNKSLWLDFKIILKTFVVVIKKIGAH